jgi:hypothetical protein
VRSRWIDVDKDATVEVTSEEEAYPIEGPLRGDSKGIWRAAQGGAQTIRLIFDAPRAIQRIWIVFEEREVARTQEFVLRWSPDGGHTYHNVVRQQYTFAPPGTMREVEDYTVQLDGVTVVELCIVPDIAGGTARASLSEWLLA